MSERWTIRPKHVQGGPTIWRVHDEEDAGRPVAEFVEEEAARAHAARLVEGPFDWDEQEAWKDPDEDEDDDWGRGADADGAPDTDELRRGTVGDGRGTS